MLDSRIFRTWDEELREERRMLLLARARSVEARLSGTPFSVSVTGSLSRGQVHPWSDLDLLMYRRDGGDLGEEGRRLRAEIVFGVEFQEFDLVPVEDVPPALERGMFGSAVAVEDVPALEGLPEPRLAIARTAMSIGFALEQCRAMDRGMADGSELRKYAAMSALRDLYSKAGLWLKRLLVFQDGGRSAWLDDHEEEGALRAALERLAGPADEPFPRPAVLDRGQASTLAFLALEAPDFGYADEDVVSAFRECRDTLDGLVRDLHEMVTDRSTHGLRF